MTRQEMQLVQDTFSGNIINSKKGDDQEAMMIIGAFHSGPISSIRFFGYIGYVLILLLQIVFAVHSYKLCIKCFKTKLFPLSLFIAMWAIFLPLGFNFIFGAYDKTLLDIMLYGCLLKVLENSIDKFNPVLE
jgi:hypothetical protein